jgi:hypothetical protein
MRKYVAVALFVGIALSMVASNARADSCTFDGSNFSCGLSEDPITHEGSVSSFDAGFDAGWLVGYSFLLDGSDPTVKANVSDVIVIHSSHVDLFDEASANFDAMYNAAIGGLDIDGIPIATGQVSGDILPAGARQFNPGRGPIGLFWETTPTIDMSLFFVGGCCDAIHITSDADFVGTSAVPEPATLTLLGIGGAVAAYRRRRHARA